MRWAMVLLIAATSTASAESGTELANATAAAFEANRAKLTAWTIEFQFTTAMATSLDDAIAHHWSDPAVAQGFSAFDGTNGRFEMYYTLKDMVEKRVEIEPHHFQSHLRSERLLTDGEVTLTDSMTPYPAGIEMRHVVQIHPGTEWFRRGIHLPLELGKGELGRSATLGYQVQLAQKEAGRSMQVQEGVMLRGMDLVEFAFTGPDDKATDYRYWFDLEHGAIPRQILAVYPNPEGGTSREFTILDDLHDVGNGAWFPYRQLTYDERTHLVHERIITKADFSIPRDPAAFQLTFDKPVKVSDTARHVLYPRGTSWDLRRLPTPERSWGIPRVQGGPLSTNSLPPVHEVPPPAMPGERAAQSKWWFIALIAFGVIALVGAITLRERPGHDAPT
jgi:hypothetical protein